MEAMHRGKGSPLASLGLELVLSALCNLYVNIHTVEKPYAVSYDQDYSSLVLIAPGNTPKSHNGCE